MTGSALLPYLARWLTGALLIDKCGHGVTTTVTGEPPAAADLSPAGRAPPPAVGTFGKALGGHREKLVSRD